MIVFWAVLTCETEGVSGSTGNFAHWKLRIGTVRLHLALVIRLYLQQAGGRQNIDHFLLKRKRMFFESGQKNECQDSLCDTWETSSFVPVCVQRRHFDCKEIPVVRSHSNPRYTGHQSLETHVQNAEFFKRQEPTDFLSNSGNLWEKYTPLTTAECHPPAAIANILTPFRASMTVGFEHASVVPCPNCPRLQQKTRKKKKKNCHAIREWNRTWYWIQQTFQLRKTKLFPRSTRRVRAPCHTTPLEWVTDTQVDWKATSHRWCPTPKLNFRHHLWKDALKMRCFLWHEQQYSAKMTEEYVSNLWQPELCFQCSQYISLLDVFPFGVPLLSGPGDWVFPIHLKEKISARDCWEAFLWRSRKDWRKRFQWLTWPGDNAGTFSIAGQSTDGRFACHLRTKALDVQTFSWNKVQQKCFLVQFSRILFSPSHRVFPQTLLSSNVKWQYVQRTKNDTPQQQTILSHVAQMS